MRIEGKNAVYELLKSGTTVNKVLIQKEETGKIVALAKQMGVKIQFVDKKVLDKESVTGKHQGYIAEAVDFEYCDLEDLLVKTGDKLIVVLDEINDPHNLGSIIRVCECAGVDGIVMGKNRQVQVNETVVRCSSGAISHVKIARVTNINTAIETMKNNGVWVYCADMDGQSMYDANPPAVLALSREAKNAESCLLNLFFVSFATEMMLSARLDRDLS